MSIRVTLTSIPVTDQEKAAAFYTGTLGMQIRHDVPAGGARWLTVVSPADPDGTEILLEPRGMDAAVTYYEHLYNNDIPATQLETDDLDAEFTRLSGLGVRFPMEPTDMDTVKVAVFDDTCGNLIQLAQPQ